jgi:Holliday junction resolvase
MYVIKTTGEREEFDPQKIKGTCLRAGASEKLANKIVEQVKKKVYPGISTREILKLTLELLHKEKPFVAARYDLKGSIFRLGPAGFAFEHLVGEILGRYGYKIKIESIVRGACVSHEIDVVAEKKRKTYMIECKYHNIPGIYTGLREVLYTYARFLDLQDGHKKRLCQKFHVPWLICNTKFSDEAIKYAKCRKIMLTGWRYPGNKGLERLVEDKKLYPVTMLRTLDRDTRDRLASMNLILLKDLLETDIKELHKITDIKIRKLNSLIAEAKGIYKLR